MKILAWSDNDTLCRQVRAKASALGELVQPERSGLPDQDPSTIAQGLAKLVQDQGIEAVLIGASKLGKSVAPCLAAHLGWPYAGEVTEVSNDGGLHVKRMVLSGNSMASYKLGANAVMTATLGTFETDEDIEGTKFPLEAPATKVQVTGTTGSAESDFDLSSAPVVVGVGRGFKAQGDIKLAEELAACFPGGAVGCSRPVAADLKWLGEEHWIGLSGHELSAKVYIAAGVSGQIQHVAGIRKSKVIVAINTNKDAPIFGVSDYGIVGDLYQVLPKLTAALK